MYEKDLVKEISNRLKTLIAQYDLTKNLYTSYQYDRTVFVSTDFDLDLIKVKGLVDINTARIKGVKIRVLVEDFERRYRNCRVYHVIRSENYLNLLYVSGDKNNWVNEKPHNDKIKAFVVNIETLKDDAFQIIRLGSKENVLERVG